MAILRKPTCTHRHNISTTVTISDSYIRCLRDGLGCSPKRSDVPTRKAPLHQSFGTTSGFQSPPLSAQSSGGLSSSGQDRQFYSVVGEELIPPPLETPQLVLLSLSPFKPSISRGTRMSSQMPFHWEYQFTQNGLSIA